MRRLYCEKGIYYPANEKVKKEWLVLATMEDKAKELLSEEDYRVFINYSHRTIRQMFGIPNKIFTFVIPKNDEIDVRIIIFPKEPDGNKYELYLDEETNQPYILIEEGK